MIVGFIIACLLSITFSYRFFLISYRTLHLKTLLNPN